jgi:hypothetical protein
VARKKRGIKGQLLPLWAPEWEPLLDLAAPHINEFMWMFAVDLADGTRLQAYKNYWTRDYLLLDGEGRTFVEIEADRYEEVGARWALARVLNEDRFNKDWEESWRGRMDPAEVDLCWAPSATARGVSRERSEYVVRSSGLRFSERAHHEEPAWHDWRLLFVGHDADGVALEIAAIGGGEEAFLVFHAMELRNGYRGLLARACEWRAWTR